MKQAIAGLLLLGAVSAASAQVPPVQAIPTPSDPAAVPLLYAGAAPGSEQATEVEAWDTFPGPDARIDELSWWLQAKGYLGPRR